MEVKKGYKHTEVGVIPEDWEILQLEAIVNSQRPICYGIVQTGRSVSNGIRCVRVVDISGGRVNTTNLITTSKEISATYKRTILAKGDLVIALRGKIGELAVIDEELVGANLTRGVALIAPINKHDSGYLCFALSSPQGKYIFEKNLNGSALQEIPIATLRKIPVALPPLSEQRAIAETLGDVDALIGSLEKLIAKKRALKQAAMQELLTGKKRLPGFSGEWEVKRLGEIAKPRTQRIDPRREGDQEFCIELENIEQNTGLLNGSNSAGSSSSIKSIFHSGDVLFGKLRAYLRKYWLANRNGVCSTEIWVLVTDTRLVIPEFLFQIVQTDKFIDVASTAYGTHMPRSDWNLVKNLRLELPATQEQSAIATVLSDMNAEIEALEKRLEKTRMLKQGMMQELLSGRTRLINN